MTDKYYAKGRADAAAGKKSTPREPAFGLFSSKKESDRTAVRAARYNEGHADKSREMKGKK